MAEHTRDMREWMRAIERRQAAVRAGSTSAAASILIDTREDMAAEDARTPAPPVEVTYQTALYTGVNSGKQFARLLVDFPAVTRATDGTFIAIKEYELWGRDDTKNSLEATTDAVAGLAAPGITFPGLAATPANKELSASRVGPWLRLATSISPSLRVDSLVPGSVWSFKVRAIGTLQKTPGLYSQEYQTQLDKDTQPPPQPTAPKLTVSLGTITVAWDGLATTGAMPADFAYLDVATGPTSSPTAVAARFYRGGGVTVLSGMDYYENTFVRFQAVDESGNRSPWSEQGVGYTTPLVDKDVILSEIDADKTRIKNIRAEAIADGAIRKEKLADGAVDLVKLEAGVQDAIAKGGVALDALAPVQAQVTDTAAKLAAAGDDLAASRDRLTGAESQLTTAFGQLGTVDSRIGTAKDAAISAAATDAQTKADAALATANALIAQVIARGTSLVRNGDFEAPDGWATSSFNAIESGNARSGSKSMRIGPNPGGNVWPTSEWVPGATNRTYYLEAWFKRTGTEAIASGVGFVLQAKTAAGGTATLTIGTVDSSTISTTAYTKVSITYTLATADAVAVRFAPWIKAGNNVYNIDDMLVVDVTEAQAALKAATDAQAAAAAAQKAAGDAQTTATSALTMAGTKNSAYSSPSAATGTGAAVGDLWRQTSAQNEVIAEWRWDGTNWIKQTVSGGMVSNMDIGYLTAGAATMSQALIDKLVANTANFQRVDVKNLFATSGTLDSAVISKLWTDVVNSQKITTQMLAVGDFTNLIPNGNGELGNAGAGWASGLTYSTADKPAGLTSAFFSAPAQSTYTPPDEFFTVEPGGEYLFAVWVKADKAGSNLYIELRDQSGALVNCTSGGLSPSAASGGTGLGYPVSNLVLPTAWTRYYAVVKPGAATKLKVARIYFNHTNSVDKTATIGIAGMTLKKRAGGEVIIDGSLTADKVAANAIGAKQLLVGDFANLAIGSDFEDASAVPWALDSRHTISTAQKKFGSASLRLGPVTDVAVPASSSFTNDMRVKEGEQWYVKLWVYLDASFNGDANSKVRIGDQNGTAIVGGTITYNAAAKSTWVPFETTLTVPAGVTSLQVKLWSTNTAGYAYVDDIQIRRVAEASLIQNLGVEKLTASGATISQAVVDKLWAEVVSAKKITADMVVISSGANAFADPMIQDAAGWNTPYFSATGGRTGGGTINIPQNSSQSGTYYAQSTDLASRRSRLVAGGTYRISGWVKTSAAAPVGSVQLYLRYGADNSVGAIATNVATEPPWNTAVTVAGAWTFISGMVTIPANATGLGGILGVYKQSTYTTGTTTWSELALQAASDASLIVDGAINATHLGVDSVTAAAIKSLEIAAVHISANAIETDKIKAGAITASKLEATLILTSTIIAGPANGTHAEMSAQGFKVYAAATDGSGVPVEVVRLGVASTSDYFAITRSDGTLAATISQDGIGSFAQLTARDALYYKGNELQTLLDNRPGGITAAAYRYSDSAYNAAAGGSSQPYLRLEVVMKPNRLYKIWTSAIKGSMDAGTTMRILLRYRFDALADIYNAADLTYENISNGENSATLQELFSFSGTANRTVSFLILFVVVGGSGQAGIRSNLSNPVRLVVEDMGAPNGGIGNGTYLDGTAPPAPAKNTYVKQYGTAAYQNYQGSNAQTPPYAPYNVGQMYQGLSPAGYGNLKSMAIMANMTTDLSGASINYIRVYFNFNHWYNNAGGTARIGLHGATGAPGTFSSNGVVVSSGGWPKPGARWVDIPAQYWDGFKSGAYRGVTLEGDGSYNTYGYADLPTIEISYTK